MLISVDTELLNTLNTHVTEAGHLVGDIEDEADDAGTINALAASLDEAGRMLEALLGKTHVAPRRAPAPECKLDVANAVDGLRGLIAKADALAHATEQLFEQVVWTENRDERRRRERLAHLVSATAEAVRVAMKVGNKLAVDVVASQAGA